MTGYLIVLRNLLYKLHILLITKLSQECWNEGGRWNYGVKLNKTDIKNLGERYEKGQEKLQSDCNCTSARWPDEDCQMAAKFGCKPTATPKCKTSVHQVLATEMKLIKTKAPKCAAELTPQAAKFLASCTITNLGNAAI